MILERIHPRRDVDATDWADLAQVAQTGPAYWAPGELDVLVIPTDTEPTAAEAKVIRRRLVTADAGDEANLLELINGRKDPGAPAWARATLDEGIARYGHPHDLI